MKQKTPQEKKALSYAKDFRNTYGENDKSSRKNIPLRKAKAHRSYRKKVNDILQKTLDVMEIEDAEIVENNLKSVKKDIWKKSADVALGKVVAGNLKNRASKVGKGKTGRKKVRETVENLEIEVKKETENIWIAVAKNLSNIYAVGETPERAVEKLKYVANVAVGNSLGFNQKVLIDGKLIKPIL